VLVALVGQPGACVVVPDRLSGANVARQVGVLRLRHDLDPDFVRFFLASESGQKALLRETLGSVQQVINLRDLEKVVLPAPSRDEQLEITSSLACLERRIAAECEAIVALHSTKSALMSVLLTGEVRVTPDEATP
jgi:type I restriction enzyme S subunit